MVDIKIVKEWMDKAEEDFLYASASLEDELPFFSQICFHFQQSAEKYLKTYIIACDLEFKKIHNLLILLKICLVHDSSFKKLREDCELLNSFYVDTRYPVHWPVQHTIKSATQAQEAARHIAEFVKNNIPK